MAVNLQLNVVSIDHTGFLTMYGDVGGFGRWCHLHGHTLSYWKYPNDQKSKVS